MTSLLLQISIVVGIILMSLIGFLKFTKKENGTLNKLGWILFVLAFILFGIPNIFVEYNNDCLNEQLNIKSDSLLKTTSELNLTTKNYEKVKIDILNITPIYYNNIYSQPPEKITKIVKEAEPQSSEKLLITNLKDSSKVGWRTSVEGKITDVNKNIYLIVHPQNEESYWVQPNVSISQDGKWSGMVYIGRSDKDSGKPYEIRAIVNPDINLKIGDVFDNWPNGEISSKTITIVRK